VVFGCIVRVSGCGKSCWSCMASRSNSRCDSVVKFCVCMVNVCGSVSILVPHVVLCLSVPSVAVVVGVLIWYVSIAYWSGCIVLTSHVTTFFSRSVLLLSSVRSVPFMLVFMPGLAGVHPVVSCSLTNVLAVVAPQPLLCMVSALSNTLSCAIVFGVSLMVSIIASVALCCMVRFACRVLLVGSR